MTTMPIPARAPISSQGAQILRPSATAPMFRTRLEPQILRNTPVQVLRTAPPSPPPATAAPPALAQPAATQALLAQAPAAAPQVAVPQAAAAPPALAVAGAAAAGGTSPATTAASPPTSPPPATSAPATSTAPADGGPPLGPEEFVPVPGEMSFAQFVQGLNPLHHLPGVGTIYRAVTGAEIHPVMRVLGGAAMGGPVGMIMAAIGAAFDQTQPLQRLGHTLAGRPDPMMPAPNSTAARAAAAYARFGGAG